MEAIQTKSRQTLGRPIAARFPRASLRSFADYNNCYAGRSCYVIGRGPTTFRYEELADATDPIFFINDAVGLEKLTRTETFFFAHDAQMLGWLNGDLRSTAVLPSDGKLFNRLPDATFAHAGLVVFYHWPRRGKEDLLKLSRDELAHRASLYRHTGTVHSLLHFVWFCGFKSVKMIGCDAIESHPSSPDGYDPRLENRSETVLHGSYQKIRQAQDLLLRLFGFDYSYLGTPQMIKSIK